MPRASTPSTITGSLALLAAVTFAVAGCGQVRSPAPASTRPAPPRTRPATAARTAGPASGSRALARRTSRRLLRALVLPPGARRAGPGSLPADLRHAPETSVAGHLLQRHEIVAVTRPAGWVYGFLRRHIPAGLRWAGSGQFGGPGGRREVDWSPRHLPPGLYSAELQVSVLAAGPRTLVRADAQVIWYPPRSRAEYLQPDHFSAVRLSATLLNPRQHAIRKVLTSRTVIAELARTLNVLPADPGLMYACPAMAATYQVTFVPAGASAPAVVAVPDSCNGVSMTAGGLPQPGLIGGSATIVLMARLLGITKTLAAAGASGH